MSSRRLSLRAMAPTVGAAVLAACAAFGTAVAHAAPEPSPAPSPQDQRFYEMVQELKIPGSSPEEAGTVGRGVCSALEAGKIEPAPTVRGIINQFKTQAGLDKGQAVNLVRGAVAVYCPQYAVLVGR